jgi:type I restriction enzyme R subunit
MNANQRQAKRSGEDGTSSVLRDSNGTSSVLRPDGFVPFDEHKAVRVYHRNLPHWRQDGCTYFVTFRLADSIPSGVREQWEYEMTQWLKARGIYHDGPSGTWRTRFKKLSSREQFLFDKHFNQQIQACLDRGYGECWLKHAECIAALREQLTQGDGTRYHLSDFVIMPNHVHVLITPITGCPLENILKAIKGKAAIECNKHLGRNGTVWQPESYDHIVRNLEQLSFYRQYIVDNPKRANITLHDDAFYRADWMDDWLKPEHW